MNQGRIWCVVNPTVGLPLFLGGVATISLIVHTAVLNNTDWMAKFFQGGQARTAELKNSTAPVASVVPGETPGFAITMSPVAATAGKGEATFVITVTPTGASTVVDDPAARLSGSRVAAGPPADK